MQSVTRIVNRVELRVILRIAYNRIEIYNDVERTRVTNPVIHFVSRVFADRYGVWLDGRVRCTERCDCCSEDWYTESVYASCNLLVGLDQAMVCQCLVGDSCISRTNVIDSLIVLVWVVAFRQIVYYLQISWHTSHQIELVHPDQFCQWHLDLRV